MDLNSEMKSADLSSDNLTRIHGRNVLHFSDGTLDLDEIDVPQVNNEEVMDPQKLSWAPWMWYYTMFAGGKALEVCDYLGEFFANFFGITTPKYQYEISEYNRMQMEEQQNSKGRDLERDNWTNIELPPEHRHMGPSKTATENIQLQYTNPLKSEYSC